MEKTKKAGKRNAAPPTTTSKTRTVKQLLRLLNPGRKKRSKWQYVGVIHDYGLTDPDFHAVEIHEIHFNPRGNFAGITSEPVTIRAENQNKLVKWLLNVRRDIKNSPVLTQKEFNLIFWGRQYGEKRTKKS